ncbi:hypothetical protein LUZ62_076543 [Rhynchospora pubera]|uniref:Late embryogenesis abundant protein LEA-2 subgroup domain-containing protein n=1 Tax=Rhynchospora pubera TaxID=906938 RepID=A0AAV8DAQ1_9POAL|nr:hypothetical protein LUZ62_076543 [Rhynchospora pubera]
MTQNYWCIVSESKICRFCAWACIILVFAAFVGGLIVLIVFPYAKFAIADANMTRFELDSSQTSLFYNLNFTMKIHKYFKADYRDMEVDCYYNNKKFDSRKLGDLKLKVRRTRLLNLSSNGNSTIDLGSNGVDAFKRSNETGFFDLEIRLIGKRITYDDDGDYVKKLSYQCRLRLELVKSHNSTTQRNFKPVKCH